jgi:DNA-binding transcriptional ArsR family regulator
MVNILGDKKRDEDSWEMRPCILAVSQADMESPPPCTSAKPKSHETPNNHESKRLTGKWPLAYSGFMSDIFEALAAAARRAILDELTERDGQTLFELCTRLTMKHGLQLTRQAISQHLDILEQAGLVTTKREGRYKFHFMDAEPLNMIVERWLKSPPAASSTGKTPASSSPAPKGRSANRRKTARRKGPGNRKSSKHEDELNE